MNKLTGASVGAGRLAVANRPEKAKVALTKGMNKVRSSTYLLLLFALIGMADAFYDSYAIHNDLLLWCPPPIDGCNTVAASPYARVFGIPLGYLGLVYYLYMFGLAALLAYDPFSRGLRVGVLLYAALGVSASICFMYIQFTFIHAFCIYCFVSAVLTLFLVVAAFSHFRATREAAI